MLQSVKELIVVAVIGGVIFWLAKPILLKFSSPEDFSRRRAIWYLVTIAAFLTPNFWLFSGAVTLVLVIVGRKDPNPAAIFLMLLFAVPSIGMRIPMIGISFLFKLDFPLMLSFFVMVPAALGLRRAAVGNRRRGAGLMDALLLSYVVLSAVLFLHPEIASGVVMSATPTDSLRHAFIGFFSLFVPFYVISRSLDARRKILEALAYFCFIGCILSAIALFEAARHWLLYSDIVSRWSSASDMIPYLMRDDSLRAAASTGHALALGTLLASMLGLWMSIKSFVDSRFWRIAISLLLWGGLIAAYSRGPWIGAAAAYFIFVILRGDMLSKPLKAAAIPTLVAAVVVLTPLGDKIRSVTPFLGGKIDDGSIVYRERLFDRSWQIISQNPLLGDQDALLKMQDLRQGQGIIDLMNGYVVILLGSGFLGLLLYMGVVWAGLRKAWSSYRRLFHVDRDFSLVGAGLISSTVSTLLMMAGGGESTMVFILAALAVGYASAAGRIRDERESMTSVAGEETIGTWRGESKLPGDAAVWGRSAKERVGN